MSFIETTNSLFDFKETSSKDRILITWNIPFTDPVTYALRCRGGAIFEQGLTIGYNDTFIPGAVRYDKKEDIFEIRKSQGWETVVSVEVDGETGAVLVSDGNKGIITTKDLDIDTLVVSNEAVFEENIVIGIGIQPPSGETGVKIGTGLIEYPNFSGETGAVMVSNGDDKIYLTKLLDVNIVEAENFIKANNVRTNNLSAGETGSKISVNSDINIINKEFKVSSLDTGLNSFEQKLSGDNFEIFRFDSFPGNFEKKSLSQQFTSTFSGKIIEIDFTASASVNSTGISDSKYFINVDLYTGFDGDNGTLIASGHTETVTVPIDGSIITTNFKIFSFNADIILGQQYNLVFSANVDNTSSGIKVNLDGTSPNVLGLETRFQEIFNNVKTNWNITNPTFSLKFNILYTSSGLKEIVLLSDINIPINGPLSSADPSGVTGTFYWNDDFFFIKTGVGWKRVGLLSF